MLKNGDEISASKSCHLSQQKQEVTEYTDPPISRLPLELYFKIISQIPPRPNARFDLPRNDNRFKVLCDHQSYGPDVKTLQTLRLVSKPFHHVASLALFENHTLVFWLAGDRKGLPDPNILADHFISSNHCVPASAIRSVSLKYYGLNGPSKPNSLIFYDRGEDDEFLNESLNDYSSERSCSGKMRFGENLHLLLQVLTHMQTFDVHLPHASTTYLGDPDGYGDAADSDDFLVPKVHMQAVRQIVDDLSSAFATPKSFPYLTDLRLTMTCTYDFSILNTAIPDNLALQLRRLFLQVSDESGSGGALEYLFWAHGPANNDEDFEPSNLQNNFPNAKYASAVFMLVERCRNLEALGISGTHVLDASSLRWRPIKPGCLKWIDLNRVLLTPAVLKALLGPEGSLADSISSPSKVHTLCMTEVELWESSWASMWTYVVENCPELRYLYISDLAYSNGGPSRKWVVREPEDWAQPRDIWTSNVLDRASYLGTLAVVMDRLKDIKTKTRVQEFFDDWCQYHWTTYRPLNDLNHINDHELENATGIDTGEMADD